MSEESVEEERTWVYWVFVFPYWTLPLWFVKKLIIEPIIWIELAFGADKDIKYTHELEEYYNASGLSIISIAFKKVIGLILWPYTTAWKLTKLFFHWIWSVFVQIWVVFLWNTKYTHEIEEFWQDYYEQTGILSILSNYI